MPIEFSCPGCQQRLSTPDGSAGQPCKCPACGKPLTIPAQTQQIPTRHNTAHKPAPQIARGSLKIPCPRCRFILECAPSLLGTKGQCRNCQHIFTISDKTTSHSPSNLQDEPTLVFHCPRCRQLFAGQAGMDGRKGKCHACGEVFAIALEPDPSREAQQAHHPLKAPATLASTSSDSSDGLTVADLAAKPKSAEPGRGMAEAVVTTPAAARPTAQVVASSVHSTAPIQFSCAHCAGTMEVPASAVGQTTNCPFCGATLKIPAKSERRADLQTGSTLAGSASDATAKATGRSQPQPIWTELEDLSGAARANPYAASTHMPYDASAASSQWPTRPRRKRLRGLTFSNAFELTLDSLFPFCLIAPLLFGMALIAIYIIFLILLAMARSMVNAFELSQPNSLWMLGMSVLIGTSLIGCFITTAAYCMTCNTALQAVRGKRVSSRVVFSTGDAYGGMLAVLLGWTVFSLVRQFGLGFLVREMAGSVDPQTALLVSILLTLALSLIQVILTFLWGFVPYALLDGQSLSNAMGTSMAICLNHFWTVVAVIICGWLLYLVAGALSIGLGLIVLMGFSFYMNAAMYHLVED